MSERKGLNLKLVGHADVDSGQLSIVDPCYLDHAIDYDEVIDSHVVNCHHRWDRNGRHSGIGGEFQAKGYANAVVVTHFGGDGSYPVYASLDEHGGVDAIIVDLKGVFA